MIDFDETRLRDRTRRPSRKARDLSRRAARTAKSARLFLALAFPADLAAFEGAR